MKTQAIDSAIEKLRKISQSPGVGLAIVQGDAEYAQGYGVKNHEKEPVTADTLFANASTTKAVTCTGIALLVDEGKMAWDDPVRKYLPQFRLSDPHADALVTVRDLCCHRTGLPRHDMLWYRSSNTREELLRRICNAKLTATFRGTYQYQNICYTVAGECARVAAGYATWEEFITERLIKRLGMNRTNFSSHLAEADPDHAEPHRREKSKIVQSEWLNFDNVGACGTMNSSPNEMLAWLKFHLSGGKLADGTPLLSEKALQETYKPLMPDPIDDDSRERFPFIVQRTYCLGWSLWNYRNGYAVLSHGGAINGFRSHAVLIPSERIGVMVYLNMGHTFVEYFRNAVMDILLDLEPMDWGAMLSAHIKKVYADEKAAEKKRQDARKNRLPHPRPLAEYVGEYDDPAYGTVHIKKDGNTLAVHWTSFESALQHQTYQTFLTTSKDEDFKNREVRFRANAAGKIISLQLFDGEFTRKES